VVGLDSQSRDIIDLHAKLFKKHGISTIRNFDALNDVNNLIYSGRADQGRRPNHEVCVTLMELPPGATGAHDAPFYQSRPERHLGRGHPLRQRLLQGRLGHLAPKRSTKPSKPPGTPGTKIPIRLPHPRNRRGGCIAYTAALEAGAEQIDLSMAPVSGGTAQTGRDHHVARPSGERVRSGSGHQQSHQEAEKVFKDCMKDYFLPPEATKVEPIIPFSPMPGGALTANTQMLRDNG
jgi:pyruvate carboxylase subunit B